MIRSFLDKVYPVLQHYATQKPVKIVAGVLLVLLALDVCFPLRVNPDYSTIITDSEGKVLHAFLNKSDKWRMQTELREM
jgi:penicillin-binding protein 1C